MNAIIGFATLAASSIEDRKKVRDYLGKILSSCNHLLAASVAKPIIAFIGVRIS